jgi:hypothetical protein
MPQCRDDKCLMGFSTEKHRNAHENLMHKTLMYDLLVRVVQKIISQNSPDKTNKKVIKASQNNWSYQDALRILTSGEPSEKQAIKQILSPILSGFFTTNPEWTAREVLSIPEFKIS